MPIPSIERVSQLVADPVAAHGLDLEDVSLISAGTQSTVRVIVDREGGVSLDAIAAVSRDISAALDAADESDDDAYTLEVTTPGINRPLTQPRHWRRARGRKVRVRTPTEKFDARVGEVSEGPEGSEASEGSEGEGPHVALVVVADPKVGPVLRTVLLSEVTEAVVKVEFSPPNPRELELAGGVTPGRPTPGTVDDSIEVEEADK
ncbi:ribosome maturation factor RimP [Antrihabitans sp. YC3-6]|uniref:Ribosome maturation factor RimP n=1 Tax=Antrihabitans stalagmiti TaxID=2799499 RepID=A0A934U5G9_9NOCA|nr:ribosome maturation factor RimP [Antrihabitans stalagmiti]MBJ8341520.1 ribosome maturation factor RimP [Antrihabitans stalagmiti]